MNPAVHAGKPEVSIVIVCMNKPEDLFPCLDCIRAQTHRTSYEIWAVAYLFTPENLAKLRTAYPEVNVVESNEIRGFSENNNLALRQAAGEFCFILNDDTLMDMPVVDLLVESFRKEPRAAFFSPKILNPDGSVQACGRAPWTSLGSLLAGFRLRDPRRARSPFINGTGIFRTFNVLGAAFMVRTAVLRDLGYFDERYFFCPEDVALSTLANEKGYFCYVNADVVLIHKACATLSRTMTATFPAMTRGNILFHARNSRLNGFFYAFFVFLILCLKYGYAFFKPRLERPIWKKAWQNSIAAVFSSRTPKDIFTRHYVRIKRDNPGNG
ncbi:MAG: glycosyltransferase [Kiritimatiellia bacterium]